jgi:hypothetical protein
LRTYIYFLIFPSHHKTRQIIALTFPHPICLFFPENNFQPFKSCENIMKKMTCTAERQRAKETPSLTAAAATVVMKY